MGLRDDLYKDVDKLFQRRLLRTSHMREKSLEAIRDGRLPEGLGATMTDVLRWVLEDREMRLRRKRDLAVLYSEWQMDKDERTSELNAMLDGFAKERETTRANWRGVQAKVVRGKKSVDGSRYREVGEEREKRLRWARDLAALNSELQRLDKEKRIELTTLLKELAKEGEVARANPGGADAKVIKGKELLDRIYRAGTEARSEEQPSGSSEQSPEEDENKGKGWQLEEWE